ncbi:MAG TPA: hypothetical protein VN702_02830 [Acetobacteraceae bacterium]|nr:hypothetical protein [Acetobacteraceae bacterium]
MRLMMIGVRAESTQYISDLSRKHAVDRHASVKAFQRNRLNFLLATRQYVGKHPAYVR